jgi:undecaprenyl-diphosphatase
VFEQIILGTIQGIAEWLPVSSEGMIVLVQTRFFDSQSLSGSIHHALFLHLGTFFAALIYFWKDVKRIIATPFIWKKSSVDNKNIFTFLLLTSLLSGIIGALLLKIISTYEKNFNVQIWASGITVLVGVLLLVTAWLQLKAKKGGERNEKDALGQDGLVVGIAQGFAAMPGLSRSGLTVSVLLLRKFSEQTALRLSFLLSLPIVLAGNIILNAEEFTSMNIDSFLGLLFSFLFGLGTIHVLLKVAKKIQFGYFVLGFGILTILSIFI